MVANTVEIWRQGPFSHILIIVKAIELEKVSVSNMDNVKQPIKMQISNKQKIFSLFYSRFLKSKTNFEHFEKKITSHLIYFRSYRLQKTWLDKCLKNHVSEEPSTNKMVNGSSHCWDLHDSTFIMIIDHCERNWVGKSLF